MLKGSKYNKIKLTIDARMINASGIGEYIKHLVSFFVKEESYEIVALVTKQYQHLVPQGTKIRILDAKIYSPGEQLLLPLKIPKCDIFWSPHYNVPLLPIRAKFRVATVHDVYHVANFKSLTGFQKIYSKLVLSFCTSWSNKIITVSAFSKREILKYFPINPSKIEVIHNGTRQVAKLKSFDEVRDRYSLPSKYILFVGNVKPHKNLSRFLEAYDGLSSLLKSTFKVVIVGKKEGFLTGDNSLAKWLNNDGEDNNVIFTGFVADEDMDTVMNYASLFVFPSLYEGFGLPPLEAMLNKVPVIASNVACMPEICQDAVGYFDPYDVDDIRRNIILMLEERAEKLTLIQKGLERIKEFTWADSFVKHDKLFLDLINQ